MGVIFFSVIFLGSNNFDQMPAMMKIRRSRSLEVLSMPFDLCKCFHRRIQEGGGGRGGTAPPPPPLVNKLWGLAPLNFWQQKKYMKDIINSREFQGDKGPDWQKTFHPRDVPSRKIIQNMTYPTSQEPTALFCLVTR